MLASHPFQVGLVAECRVYKHGSRGEEGIRVQLAGPKVAGSFVPCFSPNLSAALQHGGNLAHGSVLGKAGNVKNLP